MSVARDPDGGIRAIGRPVDGSRALASVEAPSPPPTHHEPLRVVLLDEQGRPVTGARITAEARQVHVEDSLALGDVPGLLEPLVEVTVGDGEVVFNALADVAYRVSIAREGYVGRTGIEGRPGEDLIVTLREGRALDGQVIDAETSAPIVDALVRVGGVDWNHREITRAAARTDSDGQFHVEGVGDHAVELQVSAPWYPTFKIEIPSNGPAPILAVKRATRGITGRVVESDSRESVEGVRVMGPGVETITDLDGRFLLTGIAVPLDDEGSGAVRVRFEHGCFESRDMEVTLPAEPPAGEGHAVDLNAVALLRRGALSGIVVDSDGMPVAGALMVLAPAGSNIAIPGVLRQTMNTRSGLDGRFQFETRPEFRGDLHLSVIAAGHTVALKILGADDRRVHMALDPGLDLDLAVPGEASAGRTVVLEERGGASIGGQTIIRRRPGTTDENGRLTFVQVRRGVVRISVPGGGMMELNMGPGGSDEIRVASHASTA